MLKSQPSARLHLLFLLFQIIVKPREVLVTAGGGIPNDYACVILTQ